MTDDTNVKHPIQPLVMAGEVKRFKENKIVCDMLYFATPLGFGMNDIAVRNYSRDDRIQFAQLIGYSHSGAADLSYFDDATWYAAEKMYKKGQSEDKARIKILEKQLKRLRKGLRKPVADLFHICVEDLDEGLYNDE